ncbi:hypothetical protein SAMN05216266_10584 [Amycolatopsis marina]|uniref:Uncharacterized protein n=1 Tax=Amycolatopsis marina TaxID=490629 RepID=A0A1I0YJZ2_9PSEU|nr:hypothetical protein [Amycolatopsis marina]SFB12800.1 hypothetical protein SAMN05216266_10584 [Amycolatopsis marina]
MTTTMAPSTLTLSEKIEARRAHSTARIYMASIEGVPISFAQYEWPDYVTAFTENRGQFDGMSYSATTNVGSDSPIADISKKRRDQLTENTKDVEVSAEKAVREYVDSKDRNSLHDKIEQKRKEHEKKLIDQNNKYWGDVESAIKDLPEAEQDKAIDLADQVSKFAAWLWGKISAAIVELAKRAWEWIKQAWEDIKQWFVDRYNDVTKFFNSLFG